MSQWMKRRIVTRRGYYRIQEYRTLPDGAVVGWEFYCEQVKGRQLPYQTSVLKAAQRKLAELDEDDDIEYGVWKPVKEEPPRGRENEDD